MRILICGAVCGDQGIVPPPGAAGGFTYKAPLEEFRDAIAKQLEGNSRHLPAARGQNCAGLAPAAAQALASLSSPG